MVLSLSTPAMAQEGGYKAALNPIISAIEAAPNDAKAGKDLIKAYMKSFKRMKKLLRHLVMCIWLNAISPKLKRLQIPLFQTKTEW